MAFHDTAVLLIGYRRPDLTARVLARLAEVEPPRLYVALDGPATDEVAPDCAAVAGLFDHMAWDCALQMDVATENLGCAERVRTALDWVFQRESQALIVEDDVLPGRGWFLWAERILNRHRDDPTAGMVSARNPLGAWPADGEGHLRSRWSLIWGWGTWADRWQRHRAAPRVDPEAVRARWADDPELGAFRALLAATDAGKRLDTWDMGWAVWLEASKLDNLVPARNWVENIGFDHRGTHLTARGDLRGEVPCAAPGAPDRLRAPGDFDVLCLLNESMSNGALQDPRKWRLLARNAERVQRPGSQVAWDALLLPFRRAAVTHRLIDHLMRQWPDPPPQLIEMKRCLPDP